MHRITREAMPLHVQHLAPELVTCDAKLLQHPRILEAS